MESFIGFVRWALAGSVTMGMAVGLSLFLWAYSGRASEGSALEILVPLAGGILFAAVGFVLGGIYGVVRVRNIRLFPVLSWGSAGGIIAGIVAIEISRAALEPPIQLRTVCGVFMGFLLGSAYGIKRAGQRTNTP
jgi:hypothetical protein